MKASDMAVISADLLSADFRLTVCYTMLCGLVLKMTDRITVCNCMQIDQLYISGISRLA